MAKLGDEFQWHRLRRRGDWLVARGYIPARLTGRLMEVRARLGPGSVLVSHRVTEGTFVVVAEVGHPVVGGEQPELDDDVPDVIFYDT